MNEDQIRAEFEKAHPNYGGKAWIMLEGTLSQESFVKGFKAALASQAKNVPEGYVLVPIEPTGEMLDEGRDAGDFHILHYDGIEKEGTPRYSLRKSYKAMLAAAPQPPTDDRVWELEKDAARYRFWRNYAANENPEFEIFDYSREFYDEIAIDEAIDQAMKEANQ